ncbi:MAG TPA: DMT family transporter [Gemmatimonadaceae bacterium]|nr:DMT family transporter [Gemmatimonadaceae bacterium]
MSQELSRDSPNRVTESRVHGRAQRRGVLLALAAATLFGISAAFSKLALRDISPQLLAGLLYLGSGAGLALLWLARRRTMSRETPLGRRDVPWVVASIGAGGVAAPLLLMAGLSRTTAATGSLLLNLEGAFTAGLAWVAFGERFDRRIALGMLVIVAGGVVLSWGGRGEIGGIVGPLLVAGSTLAWGLDNNLTQRFADKDPLQIGVLKGLVAGGVNTAIALSLGARWPAAPSLAAALVQGLVCYGASLVLFVLALRHSGTARTGASFSTAPFIGTAVSLVVFRERPTAAFMAAAAMMLVGVWLLLTRGEEG